VFAPESVLVLAGESDIDALDANLVLPMAIVVPGSGQSDPQFSDEPGYWVRSLAVVLAVRNSNDRTGQAAVVGANRVDVGDSRGRGILEIEPQLLDVARLLNVQEGVTVALKAQSGLTTRTDQNDRVYALQEYTFEVTCTDALYYPPARRLSTLVGTGDITLEWSLPSARFDRYRIVLRRAAGSTPPSSIADGTGVTLSGPLATSVSDVLSPGTYSYALFATYDDFSRGTNNVAAPVTDLRSSAALTASGLVVS
jgi:hypothetical protein